MTYDPVHAPQPETVGRPDPDRGLGSGPGTGGPAHAQAAMLLSPGDRDKLTARLQQALRTFVENPHQAVQEADQVFDEAATHLTDALTERRRALRESWQDQGTEAQTEELRLALRQYQESTERLLRVAGG
ncbi:hypothetical protein GCM10010252_18180 [Streptomyces aureoverticillatus]|nr:hypothetical protein GCM10010252_18180 [Streptomyces aureoverticillatus]